MKKLEYTPNSRIRATLRQLWLRSRERAKRLKQDNYTCQGCGGKQSTAKGREFKVEVHHKKGVTNWGKLFEAVREHLLCGVNKLETLCKDCHNKEEVAVDE